MIERHAITPSADLHAGPSRGLGGLLALVDGVEVAFPLAGVEVRTSIVGDVARSVVVQRFHNPHQQPLEVVHLFPLPEDGAVVALELRAGAVVVTADCLERASAEARFDEARAQGHQAALLTQERDDVHTLRVTRIPAGESVSVRLVLVERLVRVDGRYRWRFPTVIAPRFLPGAPVAHAGDGALPATDRVPDADRLQPPLRLAGGTPLDLEVEIAGPVRRLECAQHAFRVDLDGAAVRVAPSSSASLDRDFVLAFCTADDEQLVTRAWTDGAFTLVVVEPPSLVLPAPLPRDAVFVVDISGSMSGVKLAAARRALTAALRGLAAGDRFQLIAFDDRVELMSSSLLSFDEANLRLADAWIGSLQARGGTEMLPAIRAALDHQDVPGRSRSVLFITDGQAWNEAELTAAVAHRRQSARFFTFGIDTAVNGALLSRLARVGGGTCELATPSDDIEDALANLEARFGSPVLESVAVEGLPAGRLVAEAVFAGRPATLLVEGAPDTLAVTGVSASGPWRVAVVPTRVDVALGALWARERISSLEDRLLLKPFEEEALRPEIVRLALAWSIASKFTAFVAVENERLVSGELRTVVQPGQLPSQWYAALPLLAAPPPAPFQRRAAPPEASRSRMMAKRGALREESSESVSAAPRSFAPPPSPSPSPGAPSVTDPASELARTQSADGSFGQDTERTAAALLALVLLGHTRRKGSRRRTVHKAADWLASHGAQPLAATVLAWLDAAERGEALVPDASWQPLFVAGAEGVALRGLAPA